MKKTPDEPESLEEMIEELIHPPLDPNADLRWSRVKDELYDDDGDLLDFDEVDLDE